METEKTVEILKALAEGIDPGTGEQFPAALRAGNRDGGSGIFPSRASLASIAHLLRL